MSLSRRQLLLGTAGLAGAGALGTQLLLPRARAATSTGTNLVVITALGGWDTSYALDPKLGEPLFDGPDVDEDVDDPDDREAVTTWGDLDIVTNAARRPKVTAYFDRWAGRTSLVRGVWVGSVAHDECRKRVLTGTTQDTRPDLGALAAAALGPDAPIPYMDLGGAAFTGDLAALSGRTGARNQLADLLDRRATFSGPAPGRKAFPRWVADDDDHTALDAWVEARAAAWQQATAGWGRGAGRVDDWSVAWEKRGALRDARAGFVDALSATTTRTLTSQIDVTRRLFAAGLSRAVLIDTGESWDTHRANIDQHDLHDRLFGALDRLLTGLDDDGQLDNTAVVVLSEMGRTPRRNADAGKDHWPITTALLAGGAFAGGRVYGGTDGKGDGVGVDRTTGEPAAGEPMLRYDELVAGVLAALDVDPADAFPTTTPLGGLRA